MKSVFVSVFILFALSLAAYAQKPRNRGVLIDKSSPAVFVSFVQQKGIKDSGESKEQKYLLFKVTNNTRWKVWFDMSGANGKVFGDAGLYYAIENPKTDENIRGSVFCHVCSNNPLSPGHSINFSIPAEEATIDARMRLIYRFDWESDLVSNNTHSVEYYFQELPSSVVNN